MLASSNQKKNTKISLRKNLYTPVPQDFSTKSAKNNDDCVKNNTLTNNILSHQQKKKIIDNNETQFNMQVPLAALSKKSTNFIKLGQNPKAKNPGIILVSFDIYIYYSDVSNANLLLKLNKSPHRSTQNILPIH